MKPLTITATENTPAVILNAEEQLFLIEGHSFIEQTHTFYQPIIDWLQQYTLVLQHQKNYFEKNRRMTFQFKMDYFNSTSAKYIYGIISLLDEIANSGLDVRVKWFYYKEDVDMKESGEEFAHMTTKLAMKFEERNSDN